MDIHAQDIEKNGVTVLVFALQALYSKCFYQIMWEVSKLDQPQKFFLYSISNWVLLKTWGAYLFVQAKIFQ